MPKTLDDALSVLKKRAEEDGRVEAYEALDAHFASVARELEALRKEKGLSQRALAKESRVGQSEVSRILSGVTEPRIGTAQKLAHALGAEVRVVRTAAKRLAKTVVRKGATVSARRKRG
jgi:transcriptional regulator with XRE-family HTH domain